jgi:large subunit ribosomal protein L1
MLSTTGQRALPRLLLVQRGATTHILASRGYLSRAHPDKTPQLAAPEALQKVLENVQTRQAKRTKRWNSHGESRKKHNLPDDGKPYRPQDETVELAINLNVDPRKPGQSLRGSLSLPHGTGKKVAVVVFTSDEEVTAAAQAMGALHVGGESLMDRIVQGEIPVETFQRALATAEVMPTLNKKLARVLGPRGLMPNPKVGTVAQPAELLELLKEQLAGKEVQYRTEKEGILHLPIGKASFGVELLLENAGAVMNKVYEIKPENYGKTKKAKAGGGKAKAASMDTYILSAFVSSTYTKGYKVDLRTLDPASAYFLSHVDTQQAA